MSLTWSRLLLIVQFSAFSNAKLTDRRVLGSLRRKNYSDLIDVKSGNVASVDSRGFKSILRVWKSCVCLSVKFTFSSSKQNVLTKHDWAKYSWSLNLSRLLLGNLHSPGPTKLTPGNIYHFHLRRRFKFLAAHERELLFSMSRFEKKKLVSTSLLIEVNWKQSWGSATRWWLRRQINVKSCPSCWWLSPVLCSTLTMTNLPKNRIKLSPRWYRIPSDALISVPFKGVRLWARITRPIRDILITRSSILILFSAVTCALIDSTLK